MFEWMKKHRPPSRSPLLETAPEYFSPDALFDGVHWHQRWPIFRDVETPGVNPVLEICDLMQLPKDLSGRRVLDIGAWNGCFSFECERRGAAEVVAFSLENPERSGFARLKDLLQSKVRYVQGSVYSLSPKELGQFDVILFAGVLYHLRYPLLAIDRMRSVSCGEVFIESFVTTSRHLLAGPLSHLSRWTGLAWLFQGTPLWRQFRACEINPKDQSNWFGPNIAAVVEAFESAGFVIRHLHSYGGGSRATFLASANNDIPERLRHGAYEGVSPINAPLVGIDGGGDRLFEVGDMAR